MITGRPPLDYRLELNQTAASTGFFSAIPQNLSDFKEMIDYLCGHPSDSFMHLHLLGQMGGLSLSAMMDIIEFDAAQDPVVRALLLEAGTLHAHLGDLKKRFNRNEARQLAAQTPLIFLHSAMRADQSLHGQWAQLFQANFTRHRPLPPPDKTGLSILFKDGNRKNEPLQENAHLRSIIDRFLPGMDGSGFPRKPMAETIALAMQRLGELDILEGQEMRHQSSLSPIALLHKWRFNHSVRSGRLHYTLSSVQTAYGRGLSLEAARASCLMEVVERCSAFVSVDENGIVGTLRRHPLLYGSRSQLMAEGHGLLDPNHLGLEVPYQDEPLYWIEGHQLTSTGLQSIWVPAQSVFLFCNLDERSLFSGLGSTGLASGNTVAEARLSALYELLERDNEAINPYHPSRCFRVCAEDEQIKGLLDDYRARGIHLYFQDISPAYGIPGCISYVVHQDGTVAKGGAVNLDGRRAVLAALTETPYPYPAAPPSLPAPADLPWLQFESLPDFSTNIQDVDLKLVEETLVANGYSPIYVDITRKDLNIPVVKALVPRFELMADFDQYSRISRRLFSNYLKMHQKQ
jgi:ribosomal protein S12 methylthiotransferase accessory factor YcaO